MQTDLCVYVTKFKHYTWITLIAARWNGTLTKSIRRNILPIRPRHSHKINHIRFEFRALCNWTTTTNSLTEPRTERTLSSKWIRPHIECRNLRTEMKTTATQIEESRKWMPSDRIIEIEVISDDHVNRQNIGGDWIMRRIYCRRKFASWFRRCPPHSLSNGFDAVPIALTQSAASRLLYQKRKKCTIKETRTALQIVQKPKTGLTFEI